MLFRSLVPAGKFSVEDKEYENAEGGVSTRTVLKPETFRYDYPLNQTYVYESLERLLTDSDKLEETEVNQKDLQQLLEENTASELTEEKLAEIGLDDDELYDLYGDKIYDQQKKRHKTARVWGTDDVGGFGFLNYIFEGLVSGDKYGSAVGIVALILVVGGAFGIIMSTGAIDAGIYSFINKTRGLERLALPILFFLFSLGGATFGIDRKSTRLNSSH